MERFIKQINEEQEKGKNRFSGIDKKNLAIGAGIILALGAIVFMFGGEKTEVAVKYGVTTNEVKETVREVVEPVYKEQKEIRKTQEELTKQITLLNKTLNDLSVVLKEKTKGEGSGETVPINIPEKILGEKITITGEEGEVSGGSVVPIEPPKPKIRHISIDVASTSSSLQVNNPVLDSIKEETVKKKEEAEPTVYIPAGSIVEGRLMYGFTAPQSGMFPPVLIEFTKPIRTANGRFIPLQRCLVVTSAQYDMSQGVAILGGLKSKMSCVLKNGKVVEKDVNIAVGEEKKGEVVQIGLSGEEKWLTGEDFAKITTLVSISGMANSYKQSLVQQSITPQGNVITAIRDGGIYSVLGGVNEGINRFVDFWMKKYDQKVPAIEVQPKERVFVVFVNGVDTGIQEEELM